MKIEKLKGIFEQCKGKTQVLYGKLIRNEFHIINGKHKELHGKFIVNYKEIEQLNNLFQL